MYDTSTSEYNNSSTARLDIQYNYDTMFMSWITIFNLLQTCTKLEYVMLMFQMLKTSSMIVSCNKLVCHIT